LRDKFYPFNTLGNKYNTLSRFPELLANSPNRVQATREGTWQAVRFAAVLYNGPGNCGPK
jgi:hypothetical protein